MNPTFSDILWYVAIGAFIFMMFRGGGCCGGHHKKQKQEGSEDHAEHKH